jgi:two-component system OmpR family sensor kinase
MTAEGASSQSGPARAPGWRAVRRLSSRTSLRTKLITALITLVILALAAISFAGISILRGYLIGQTDNTLRSETIEQLGVHAVNDSLNGNGCGGTGVGLANSKYSVWWIPAGGALQQIVQPVAGGFSTSCTGNGGGPSMSAISAVEPRLVANPGLTTTVPGQVRGDRWRVISYSEPVSNGTNGTMIIGTDVSSVYGTIQQLAGVDLIVSIVIVFVLLIAAIAVVRANLRPLVDIEETAGEIADGHLNRRVPERDPRTEIGSLGRSLNIMLSQIETAFHSREESEAAAHQSEERMRRFIADASHELRTPLTAIRGFAEYYRQRGGLVPHWDKSASASADTADRGTPDMGAGLTPDDLDRIMHRVETEAARMGLLVEDLLLLAADAVHDARLLAPARTIDLSVQPGAAFLVIGDEARLRQVIGNLMSNALTHTPDGSPIEVSIGSGTLDPRMPDSARAVTLDVTDHGPGMLPEQAQRVFERFYRADQSRTRTKGGSGLGLAIVSALVTAHGGVASVRTGPGRGSTFRIALPLDPGPEGGMAADDDPDLDEASQADETDASRLSHPA